MRRPKLHHFAPLSEDEKELVVAEVVNRIKDIVWMNAEKKVREVVDKVSWSTFCEEDSINFTYDVNLVGSDIMQIVGRQRRDDVVAMRS